MGVEDDGIVKKTLLYQKSRTDPFDGPRGFEAFVVWRALLVFGLILCGCATPPGKAADQRHDPELLLGIERGASRAAVEDILGPPAQHEFSVVRNGEIIDSVRFDLRDYYHLVFTDGVLSKIMLAPRGETGIGEEERALGIIAPWDDVDPIERLEIALGAPDLTPAHINHMIEKRRRKPKIRRRIKDAIWRGVLDAGNQAAMREREKSRERKQALARIQELAKRFDPARIKLGMDVSDIELACGPPLSRESRADGTELRNYGSDLAGRILPLLWVCVQYRQGKAIGVFRDQFYDLRRSIGLDPDASLESSSTISLNLRHGLLKQKRKTADEWYYLAALQALLRTDEAAMDNLEQALALSNKQTEGGQEAEKMRSRAKKDQRFKTLRELERFQSLVDRP